MMQKGIVVLLLVSAVCFQGTSNAAEIDGPANVRLRPGGKAVIELNDGIPVHLISAEGDWFRIGLRFCVDKSVLAADNTVPKDTILKDTNGKEIGRTTGVVKATSVSDWGRGVIVQTDAYTFKDNIRQDLVVEDYRIAKNTDELFENSECVDHECVPASIRAKRQQWRKVKLGRRGETSDPVPGKHRAASSALRLIYPDTGSVAKHEIFNNDFIEERPIEIHLRGQRVYKGSLLNTPFEDSLKSLYVYDGHWIFEFLEPDIKGKHIVNHHGVVVVDGVNLNDRFGYVEAFNYILIKNKPFYFFSDNSGGVKMNYAGKILPNKYDKVLFTPCCSESAFNAEWNDDMIWFYAMRDGALYYVEAGVY